MNGRIEGDSVILSSKYSGKISQLLAREGDDIRQGQTVITLDDPETRARLAQAQRAYDASVASAQAAGKNVGYTAQVGSSTILQAHGQLLQANSDIHDAQAAIASASATVNIASEGIKGYAAQVDTARAKLQSSEKLVASWEAQVKQSAANAKRYTTLAKDGVVTEQAAEQYVTAAAKDQAQLDSARAEADSTAGGGGYPAIGSGQIAAPVVRRHF